MMPYMCQLFHCLYNNTMVTKWLNSIISLAMCSSGGAYLVTTFPCAGRYITVSIWRPLITRNVSEKLHIVTYFSEESVLNTRTLH